MASGVVTIKNKAKQDVPVTRALVADLKWWAENGRDQRRVQACRAELERRASGKSQAIAPAASGGLAAGAGGAEDIAFQSYNPASVTAWFSKNAERFHLISPATMVQTLLPGTEVALTTIKVNPDPDMREVYANDEGSGLCLNGMTLARLSAAAGITWNPELSVRCDNRRDPFYVEHRAVGAYRLFDGSPVVETATRAVDLRDSSPWLQGKSEGWIRQNRKFINEMAESKAKNRVIRRLGLKSAYNPEELEKPFAIARLMFTGRTDDPELSRAFAMLNAQKMLEGGMALFGTAAPSLPGYAQPLHQARPAPPPALTWPEPPAAQLPQAAAEPEHYADDDLAPPDDVEPGQQDLPGGKF